MAPSIMTLEAEANGVQRARSILALAAHVYATEEFQLYKMTVDHYVLVGPEYVDEPAEITSHLPSESEWGATFETLDDALITHYWRK